MKHNSQKQKYGSYTIFIPIHALVNQIHLKSERIFYIYHDFYCWVVFKSKRHFSNLMIIPLVQTSQKFIILFTCWTLNWLGSCSPILLIEDGNENVLRLKVRLHPWISLCIEDITKIKIKYFTIYFNNILSNVKL
jgi:hypothetical protein